MSDDPQATVDSANKFKPSLTDLLLVVFIHGFKGTDTTFMGFPDRMKHVLSETIENVLVECIVFPAYETKGELTEAVERFADWLTTLTVEREVANGTGGGAGKANIVLCGHSMGGFLAADALLEIVNSRPDKEAPVWPKIIACIAFDTPYLGLHPFVFKNNATKAVEYATTARTVATDLLGTWAAFGAKRQSSPPAPSQVPIAALDAPPRPEKSNSSWGSWTNTYAVGGAALLAGAAASAAYYKRKDLGMGYAWFGDHMKFVRNLWDEDALQRRLGKLVTVEEETGIVFRTFYTFLPPEPPVHPTSRTFVVLPHASSAFATRFLPARNSIAPDELQAHTGMFGGKTNDGYYDLGLATAKVIGHAVMISRRIVEQEEQNASQDTGQAEIVETETSSQPDRI